LKVFAGDHFFIYSNSCLLTQELSVFLLQVRG
jgi:hypothetical protein